MDSSGSGIVLIGVPRLLAKVVDGGENRDVRVSIIPLRISSG
jgi:hypothetical protein